MYTIGIDLGGTNIVASVVDDEYKIIVNMLSVRASSLCLLNSAKQ